MSMKAIYFTRTGEPGDVLQLGDFPLPIPGPGEVLVRVLRRVINPSDAFFIRGKYRFQPEFPQIAGMEGVGVIEGSGTLVSFFYRKAWAEYAVVPESGLFALPAGFPLDKAAQFTLNPFTAWGLLERAAVPAGGWLLLSAGNSAVSRIILQLARLRGIRTIAMVRSMEHAAALEALGAFVIDTAPAAPRVLELTGGVSAALDAVGGSTGTDLISCLAPGGKFIAYGAISPEPLQVANPALVYKFVSLSGFGIRSYMDSKTVEEKKDIAAQLIRIVGEDGFSLLVAGVYPLEEFKTAVGKALDGKTEGKVLLGE